MRSATAAAAFGAAGLVAGFAAYAFTFMTFPGRDLLFSLVVALLIVPVQVALTPLVRLYGDLGLMGTYAAVYLAHIGFNMPLAVFILRSYMLSLPTAVIESAKVDGASHFQIFWRVVLPLSVPVSAAGAALMLVGLGACLWRGRVWATHRRARRSPLR